MNAPETVDAQVVEEHPEQQALVPIARAQTLAVTPPVKASELVERLDVIRDAMQTAMVKDIDYGNVPGTDKPTLFKPGSEKLGVLFQLDIQLDNEKTWGPGDHLTVISRATAFHAPTGTRLGFGEGVCTTRERKYAYRRQERTCPTCGKPAVIKGKAEFGGGWLCWKKKDGCGTKFSDGDTSIEGQQVGDIDNPDLPDLWNTVVKMAEKRARIDAVLAVTGASALFTQDVDDSDEAGGHTNEQPPADSPPAEPMVTREQYQQIVAEFGKVNTPKIGALHKLAKFLGVDPTPAAIAEHTTPEAGRLTAKRADETIRFLQGLAA